MGHDIPGFSKAQAEYDNQMPKDVEDEPTEAPEPDLGRGFPNLLQDESLDLGMVGDEYGHLVFPEVTAVEGHILSPWETWWSRRLEAGTWRMKVEYHVDYVQGGLYVDLVTDGAGPYRVATLFPEDQKKKVVVNFTTKSRFNIAVKNGTAAPITLEKITLQEVASEKDGAPGGSGPAQAEATRAGGNVQASTR